MNATTQFNPVSGSVFSGRNELSCLEAKAEHGYKSNRWITFFQAKQADLLDGVTLKGKAVGMVRFGKDEKGKSEAKWYNVFNLDLFTNVPAELTNAKPSKKVVRKTSGKKAAKAAPKKASGKKAVASAAPTVSSDAIAIPVQGMPNTFLIPNDKGVYTQITL